MLILLHLLQAYVYRFNSYLRCYNLSAPAEELSLIRVDHTEHSKSLSSKILNSQV